jgi:hypothetical protein
MLTVISARTGEANIMAAATRVPKAIVDEIRCI